MSHHSYLVCYNLFSNNKFISSIEKVFFACILKIYCFYQFIINLVQIDTFMFFPQIINNSKTLLSIMVKSKSVMKPVAVATVSKLTMFQIEDFVTFIDYVDVGVIIKLSQ